MKDPIVNDTVIYSGVWLPNSLTYFVNGVPVSHFAGDFATPMNVIVNLAVARDNYPFNPGPDAQTVFPANPTGDKAPIPRREHATPDAVGYWASTERTVHLGDLE